MSNLYDTLCVVRTSMLNVIGQMYLEGQPKNLAHILEAIGDEINTHVDFMDELLEMDDEELFDLGFDYLNDEDALMLFPVWLYPFIPRGTELLTIEGDVFIREEDESVTVYGDHWINVGFLN